VCNTSLIEVVVKIFDHVSIVGCSQASDWIPSNSAIESLATWAATVFSAKVVSLSDVLEAGAALGLHLV